MFHLILLILALVLFLLEGFHVSAPRCALGWLGLAALAGSFLVGSR